MKKYLLVVVFISGLVSLAVEFAASRLLGNYFGTSNLVWASIVGLILIYLTLGYFIGGSWADRSPKYETLFKILSWAALAIGLIPIASRPILRIASQAFDNLALGSSLWFIYCRDDPVHHPCHPDRHSLTLCDSAFHYR